MINFFKKYKAIFIGFGLACLTILITYLIFGLIQKNFYLWGVIQLIISFCYCLFAWFTAGLINKNIRRNANNKLADTSYKNPKKAEYKTFLHSFYYAFFFGAIFNLIGFYAFGMGKFVPTIIVLFL